MKQDICQANDSYQASKIYHCFEYKLHDDIDNPFSKSLSDNSYQTNLSPSIYHS